MSATGTDLTVTGNRRIAVMGLFEPVGSHFSITEHPLPQFGPVRSARPVFASSTENRRNSLIVFDFSDHHRHHCRHRFSWRFGITQTVESATEKCLQIFVLRPIENGVRASVNP